MPWFAAACSAWFLICSTSRSVTREMSPASPPNPAKPRPPKPAKGESAVSALGLVGRASSALTATRTSRPSRRTSTTRSPSASVTSAARSERAFIKARRAAGSIAAPSSAPVRWVCSSPAAAADARSSRSRVTYLLRSMTP